MARQIGDALVSAIEQVDISTSTSSFEIDLIGEKNHLLVDGENEGEEIEIEFYIINEEFNSISEIEEQVKELASKPVNENVFDYQDNKGFISVENVSIPEDSSTQTLRQGTISGQFLPFPQNFPQQGFLVLIASTAIFDGRISGGLSVERRFDVTFDGMFDSEGDLIIEKIFSGGFNSSFEITASDGTETPILSSEIATVGDLDSTLMVQSDDAVLSMEKAFKGSLESKFGIFKESYGNNYGDFYSSQKSVLAVVTSVSGFAEGQATVNGELDIDTV